MKIFKKWWFWLIVILLLIAGGIYLYISRLAKNLEFTFKPGGNLGNLLTLLEGSTTRTANGFQTQGFGGYLDMPYKTIIDNANNVGINLKDVFAKVSYNGESVLETKPDSAVLENINIPANAKMFEVNDTIRVLLNGNTIQLIRELIKKSKPTVDITVRGKSLGFPINKTFKQQLEY